VLTLTVREILDDIKNNLKTEPFFDTDAYNTFPVAGLPQGQKIIWSPGAPPPPRPL